MAANNLTSKPKHQARVSVKESQRTAPLASKVPKGKTKASGAQALATATISEQELMELSRVVAEINQQLESMHEDMQDIIRDMRAMRGVDAK